MITHGVRCRDEMGNMRYDRRQAGRAEPLDHGKIELVHVADDRNAGLRKRQNLSLRKDRVDVYQIVSAALDSPRELGVFCLCPPHRSHQPSRYSAREAWMTLQELRTGNCLEFAKQWPAI